MPWAHASPQPKWHLDRCSVFAQMTVECLCSLQWFTCFPLKIAHLIWITALQSAIFYPKYITII